MKVLLDENLTATFERKLRELLEPEGASIHSVNEEGWAGYQNGELMAAMGGTGFTHMITYDKRMSGQTVPSVPVMLLPDCELAPNNVGLPSHLLCMILAAGRSERT